VVQPDDVAGEVPARQDAAQRFATQHVAAFNAAVRARDFGGFLARLADDAVIRFENVPGVGVLEFAGRAAYTSAYASRPPDDQIDMVGPARDQDGSITIPFAWRRDGARGTMRITVSAGLIVWMTVRFDERDA
jgi:hypothetical protein